MKEMNLHVVYVVLKYSEDWIRVRSEFIPRSLAKSTMFPDCQLSSVHRTEEGAKRAIENNGYYEYYEMIVED